MATRTRTQDRGLTPAFYGQVDALREMIEAQQPDLTFPEGVWDEEWLHVVIAVAHDIGAMQMQVATQLQLGALDELLNTPTDDML